MVQWAVRNTGKQLGVDEPLAECLSLATSSGLYRTLGLHHRSVPASLFLQQLYQEVVTNKLVVNCQTV